MKTNTTQTRRGPGRIFLVTLAAIFIGFTPCAYAQYGEDDPVEPESRTVLITGANRGIRLELARQYSAQAGRNDHFGWIVYSLGYVRDHAHTVSHAG